MSRPRPVRWRPAPPMPPADDDGGGEAGAADLRHSQHNRQSWGRRTGRVTRTYLPTPENPTTPANLANPLETDRIDPRSLRHSVGRGGRGRAAGRLVTRAASRLPGDAGCNSRRNT